MSNFSDLKDILNIKPVNCIIPSVPKCGTSSLMTFLSYHPDVINLDSRQIGLFNTSINNKYQYFTDTDRKIIISSDHFLDPFYGNFLLRHQYYIGSLENMKIIHIMRDPMQALLSMYIQCILMNRGYLKSTFETSLLKIALLYDYKSHLAYIDSHINPKNTMIISFEYFIDNIIATMMQCYEFLGLESNQVSFDERFTEKVNRRELDQSKDSYKEIIKDINISYNKENNAIYSLKDKKLEANINNILKDRIVLPIKNN